VWKSQSDANSYADSNSVIKRDAWSYTNAYPNTNSDAQPDCGSYSNSDALWARWMRSKPNSDRNPDQYSYSYSSSYSYSFSYPNLTSNRDSDANAPVFLAYAYADANTQGSVTGLKGMVLVAGQTRRTALSGHIAHVFAENY